MPSPSSNSSIYKRFSAGGRTRAHTAEPGPGVARRIIRALPALAPVLAGIARLLAIGTEGYPEDVRRRLKIVNCIAYLIGFFTIGYVIQYSLADYAKYYPLVWLNAGLASLAVIVPNMHRFGEIAGGLLIVVVEFAALFAISALLGRSSGAQLHYFIAPAAAFVIFGPGRLRLALAIVAAAVTLSLTAWFSFPPEAAAIHVEADVVDPLFLHATITTAGLIAASVWYAFSLAEQARAETDAVLLNTLPETIVARLKAEPDRLIADGHDQVSVIFADISGFVALSKALGSDRVVALLNDLVRRFDDRSRHHGVEKIKTIGDAYMAVAGVPNPHPAPAHAAVGLAVDMLRIVDEVRRAHEIDLAVRIGVATGPVMAGVIGTHKFSYDVWGDTVNLASRLEGASQPGRILVCEATCAALSADIAAAKCCDLDPAGEIEIKGQGLKRGWFVCHTDEEPAGAEPAGAMPAATISEPGDGENHALPARTMRRA